MHDLPDEAVVRWGDKIGSHGADVVSVNTKTGDVTLWDAKYRSNEVRIQPSPTFKRDASRANAIKEAKKSIANNKTLPEDIKRKALDNLEEGKVKTRTVGMGNAKNSRTE